MSSIRKPTNDQRAVTKLLRRQGYVWNMERMVERTLRLYNEVELSTRKQLRFLVAEVDGYGNVRWGDRVA